MIESYYTYVFSELSSKSLTRARKLYENSKTNTEIYKHMDRWFDSHGTDAKYALFGWWLANLREELGYKEDGCFTYQVAGENGYVFDFFLPNMQEKITISICHYRDTQNFYIKRFERRGSSLYQEPKNLLTLGRMEGESTLKGMLSIMYGIATLLNQEIKK